MRPVETRLVYAAGSGQPDHWVSRWLVYLPSLPRITASNSRPEHIPVVGAVIEVRIGAHGYVIGVSSSWRPWTKRQLVLKYAPPEGGESHHQMSGVSGREAMPLLYYVVYGMDEPQRFIAPYYGVPPVGNAHAPSSLSRPASEFSLFVMIRPAAFERGGVRLGAFSMDRQGEFQRVMNNEVWRVSWQYCRLDQFFSNGLRESNLDELVLTNTGVYHAEVMIENLSTSAVASTYQVLPVLVRGRPETSRGVV